MEAAHFVQHNILIIKIDKPRGRTAKPCPAGKFQYDPESCKSENLDRESLSAPGFGQGIGRHFYDKI